MDDHRVVVNVIWKGRVAPNHDQDLERSHIQRLGIIKHYLLRCEIVSEWTDDSKNKAHDFNNDDQNSGFFLFSQSV
jgi:hypothetical protein